VDRLIALVVFRWRMELRTLLWARERALGLVFLIPGLVLFSAAMCFFVFFALEALERAQPDSVLPLVSAAATGVGLFWAISPLLAGVALSDTHDVSRLMHFPIPLGTLAVSSLVANLTQPAALAQLPVVAAVAAALARTPGRFPGALVGVALTFLGIVVAAQVAGLLLHGLSRNRRLHDVFLFVGLGFGFLLSLVPFLVLMGGAGDVGAVARVLTATDVFVLSPYAWGVRAAVHAGRGQTVLALAFGALGTAAVVGATALSGLLVHRIQRGDLDLGVGRSARGARARMRLPGALGALVEKDLRVAWRDPGLRAVLVMGLVGPLVVLFLLSRGGPDLGSGTPVLLLATFVGISTFGANALGLERRGLGLLMSFPVARWRILVGKNLATVIFRLPGLVTLLLAALFLAPLAYLPAATTIALITLMLSAGADNFLSILFPIAAPPPSASPYGRRTLRGRGLGAAVFGMVLLAGALALASPFVFLAWLPSLLGRPWLWAASLPLAIAGAASVYGMLVAGAGRLLQGREPELLERILGEP
jgi:ABC-2 type transport system permease protein